MWRSLLCAYLKKVSQKKFREVQAPTGNSTKHVSVMVQKSLHGEWFTLCWAVSQYIMGIWTIFIGLTIPYWMFTTYSQCKFGPWQISKCKTCQRNMEQTKTSLNFSIAINYPEKQAYLNTTGSLHAIYSLEMTLQWHDLNITIAYTQPAFHTSQHRKTEVPPLWTEIENHVGNLPKSFSWVVDLATTP